jgi:hypothetical protein
VKIVCDIMALVVQDKDELDGMSFEDKCAKVKALITRVTAIGSSVDTVGNAFAGMLNASHRACENFRQSFELFGNFGTAEVLNLATFSEKTNDNLRNKLANRFVKFSIF